MFKKCSESDCCDGKVTGGSFRYTEELSKNSYSLSNSLGLLGKYNWLIYLEARETRDKTNR